MKKLLLISFCFALVSGALAQDQPKQHEAGLVFSGLNNFGLTYRSGNSASLWRFNSTFLNGRNERVDADSSTQTIKNSGLGFSLGKEWRKPVSDRLVFRYGTDLSANYYSQQQNYTSKQILNPNGNKYSSKELGIGINAIIGFNYELKNNLVIGAELLPGIRYSQRVNRKSFDDNLLPDEKSKGPVFSYGLSSSSALLSLVYRF